jgi:hypothetical protein
MVTRGQSLWLPKAQVLVCLKPGNDLSEEEVEALEEFFLLLQERVVKDDSGGS